jgi:hypothetical protein
VENITATHESGAGQGRSCEIGTRLPALKICLVLVLSIAARPDVIASLPQSPAEGKETGWIPLFNGKNLDGWYTWLPSTGRDSDPRGVFKVEDGSSTFSIFLQRIGSRSLGTSPPTTSTRITACAFNTDGVRNALPRALMTRATADCCITSSVRTGSGLPALSARCRKETPAIST